MRNNSLLPIVTAILVVSFITVARYCQAQTHKRNINTLLISAASEGDLVKIKDLLAKGADPNIRNRAGYTPLMLLLQANTIISNVKKNSLSPSIGSSLTFTFDSAISSSPQSQNVEAVSALLAKGADVNAANRSGTTPIMLAASYESTEYIHLLLLHRADIYATSNNGSNVVLWAAGFWA